MGLVKIGSVSRLDGYKHPYSLDSEPKVKKVSGQPNPSRWKYHRSVVINHHLILDVEYEDCTNFEGRKIMMFDKGITLKDIERQKLLDPHFSESSKFIHPIARFVPTQRGWQMAIDFAISTIR